MKSESLSERKRAFLYINDILDTITTLKERTFTLSKEEFESDDIIRESIIWRIYLIGEAVRNLPADVKAMAPDVPWRAINGMRNKLAHQYFGVKFSLVWHTLTVSIPEIEPSIKKIWEQLKEEIGDEKITDDR